MIEKLREKLAEYLDVPLEEIKPDSHFENDLLADSLETLNLFLWCEDEFKIQIADSDREFIHNVKDLAMFIDEAQKKQNKQATV